MDSYQRSISNERSLLEGLIYYISILKMYKKLIFINTSIAAIVSIAFSIVSLRLPPHISPLPNQYTAYAIVMFQEGISNAAMNSMLSAFGIESQGSEVSPSQLAIKILQSRSFIDDVVKEFEIIERYDIRVKPVTNSRKILLDYSEYKIDKATGSLTISFSNYDPLFASKLVNYEVDLLESWFLEQGGALRSYEIELMEEKLDELSEEIATIESQIESFQKKYGVLDIMELAMTQSTMIRDLRTTLNQVELQISDYSEYSTIDDPSLIILKNKRDNIVTQINKIEAGYTGRDGRNMPSIEELPKLSLSFSHMQSELALKNQLYLTLSERYEVTKLSVAETGAFSVFEYAEIPEEKSGPSRGSLCITITFVSFIFSLLLAFYNHTKKRIKDD